MTKLPADLEALMPEPGAMLSLNGGAAVRLPYFTDDQVREAMLAATERAAKLAEAEAVEETGESDAAYNMAIRHCAAAIRGTGGGE